MFLSLDKCWINKKQIFFYDSDKLVIAPLSRTIWPIFSRSKWNKWSRCKKSLNFLFSIQKYKFFLMMGLRLWKRGWYVTTRSTPVSRILSLSNTSSKRFSVTLLIWASAAFCGHHLLQNQVFKFLRCFFKVHGDDQSLLIRNPWL